MRDVLAIMRADDSIAHELPFMRKLVLKTFGWLLLTELIWVLQLFPVKFFIDEFHRQKPDLRRIVVITMIEMVILIAGSELKRVMHRYRGMTFWRFWYVCWSYGHWRELRLSTDWHIRHSTGEKESLVGKNIERFQELADELVFNTVPTTLRIAITTAMMFTIGWRSGLFASVTVAAYAAVILFNERRLAPMHKEFIDELRPIERFGTELTCNWRTIKSIGREEDFAAMNDEMLRSFWESERQRNRQYEGRVIWQDRILVLSRGLLWLSTGWLMYTRQISVGAGVLAFGWMETKYANLWRYTDFQRQLHRGLEALKQLVDVMRLPPTVQQAAEPQWPEPLMGSVSFENVSFSYPECERVAIKGIDLEVPAYSTLALVGYSGCGKTTLMSLLQREYDPDTGRILIDGKDLSQLDYLRLRRELIGVVSQNVELFDGSILDNIRVTNPGASIGEVMEVARLANAHEFILETEEGYETQIGQSGIRLSGGQRQRLAIARALLRNPAILIMDEATSALDAISQQRIQESIDRLIAERRCTIFIIAHRFSTIMRADLVAVLDEGQIVELGTHAELARMNGLYMKLREMETRGLLD